MTSRQQMGPHGRAGGPSGGCPPVLRPRVGGDGVPGLRVRRVWTDEGRVVVLVGEVDLAAGPDIACAGRLPHDWSEPAVVDAGGVTFCDAAGLRAVMALAVPGAPVRVVRPPSCLLHLLQLMALAGCGPRVAPPSGRDRAIGLWSAPGGVTASPGG